MHVEQEEQQMDASELMAGNKEAGGHGRRAVYKRENKRTDWKDRRDWPRRSIYKKEFVMIDERKRKHDEEELDGKRKKSFLFNFFYLAMT